MHDNLNHEHVAGVAESSHTGLGDAVRDGQRAGIPWALLLSKLFVLAAPEFIAWVKKWIENKDTAA